MVTVQIASPPIHETYTKTNDDVRSSASSLESLCSIPRNDDIRKALQILDSKEWTNVEQFLNPWGADRITLVHLAAYRGNLKMLERAGALKADLYAVDKLGRCALHYAADKGHVDVVRWLLEHFAAIVGLNGTESSAHPQLSLADMFGNTPLHEAIRGRHTSVVNLLVNAGSNVDAQNDKFHTPLLLVGAILEGVDPRDRAWYENVVSILVTALASVNVCDPITGNTPLHHAVELDSRAATERLLEAGARLDAKNKQGWTPLYTAANLGHLKCVHLLVNSGGYLASRTNNGDTVCGALLKYGTRSLALVTDILNSRIYAKGDSNDVILDFGVLAPRGELQMAVIADLIEALPNPKGMDILQHPLLEAFLRLKWSRFRYFYYIILALQYSFTFLLVLYTIVLAELNVSPLFLRRVILAWACALLLNNFMQILLAPKHYKKKLETWLSITCAMSSASVAVGADFIPETTMNDEELEPDAGHVDFSWLVEFIGIIIPLAVVQVEMFVAQHSEIGRYVLAFVNVFKKFLTILLKCSAIIGGLSCGLMILFSGENKLSGTWNAIESLIATMFGEGDHTEFLFTDDEATSVIRLTDTIRAVSLIFVLLAVVVLTYLILSLAISNIQQLVKEGRNCQIKNQAEFFIYCEQLTSGWIFRNRRVPSCLKRFMSKNMVDTRMELKWATVYAKHPRKFPEKLLDKLFDLGLKNSQLFEE